MVLSLRGPAAPHGHPRYGSRFGRVSECPSCEPYAHRGARPGKPRSTSQVIWAAPTSFRASQAIRTGRSSRRSRRSRQTRSIGRPRPAAMRLKPANLRQRPGIGTSTRSLGDRRRPSRTSRPIRRPGNLLRTRRRRRHPPGRNVGTRPTRGPTSAPCARAESERCSRSASSRPSAMQSATSTWAVWRSDRGPACPQPSHRSMGISDGHRTPRGHRTPEGHRTPAITR